MVPTIYYTSRTHSQISQVIREYRKTSYRVPMAILASRKHYCINEHVSHCENVDKQCKLLLDDKVEGCYAFRNYHKVRKHLSLKKGGCNEVHDIEDLVKVGKSEQGCPYFAACYMAEEAHLVFAPYNYIISPIVRRAMNVDISGSIVILDEAHNIEDVAREAGSVDVDEDSLHSLVMELAQLSVMGSVSEIYQPLHDAIQGLGAWIVNRKSQFQKHEFELSSSFWTGENAMRELGFAGITPQCFPIFQECATKAVKAASDVESEEAHLCAASAIILDGLFSSLAYFFAENGRHSCDYQLVLREYIRREGNSVAGQRCTMSLWCLNPAVVFSNISNLCLSLILTSGTLSPMSSFSCELGVQFEACMEAPPVINVDSQLWAAVVSSGPTKYRLNTSYKTADAYAFQDELGATLEEICKVVPGGALVFFPSYKLLDKLCKRWFQTGQWSRLNAQKPVFVEPKGTEEFESALKGYYDAIHGKNTASKRRKSSSKQTARNCTSKHMPENSTKGRAAFLAVCRGKVSEGIDFSDENARVVVIVGIPFPNVSDAKVILKKKYNDMFKSSKGLVSGSEWYCHQAFRALNQAAGRCIRHRFDYGAIILLDERYMEDRNVVHVSKWIRDSLKQFDNFDEAIISLQAFFKNVAEEANLSTKDGSINEELATKIVADDDKMENFISSSKVIHGVPLPEGRIRKGETKRHKWRIKHDDAETDTECLPQQSIPSVVKQLPSSKVLYLYEPKTPRGDCEKNDDTREKYDTPQSKSAELIVLGPEDNVQQSPSIGHTHFKDVATCSSDFCEDCISPAVVVNGCNHSKDMVTSEVTPERLPIKNISYDEPDSSLSYCGSYDSRKRRKPISYLSSCMSMRGRNSDMLETFSKIDQTISTTYEDTNEMGKLHIAASCSRPKHQGYCQNFIERNSVKAPLSQKEFLDKSLRILCLQCRTPVGTPELNYLVSCSFSTVSKVYVSHVSVFGHCALHPSITTPTPVQALVCDVSSISSRFLSGGCNVGASQGVWSEKDGCVFRPVCCPCCNALKPCVGVQILATDAVNSHLLNKVLLFVNLFDITNSSSVEEANQNCAELEGSQLSPIEVENYKCSPTGPMVVNSRRSKLRLPKIDPSSG